MIMVKSLSENEKATKSALEAFISSITISQDWTDDIYELPVCARMPLLMLYQTCNKNSENKKKCYFLLKLCQLVVKVYTHKCPKNTENEMDVFVGSLVCNSVKLPKNVPWNMIEPHFKNAAESGEKSAQFILSYRAEIMGEVENAFPGLPSHDLADYLTSACVELLGDYASDMAVLYDHVEKNANGRRIYSDNREYIKHRTEFKMLRRGNVSGFEWPSQKVQDKFFQPYWG